MPRRRLWAGAAIVFAIGMLGGGMVGNTFGAFSGTTSNGTNSFSADTLNAPTSLTATGTTTVALNWTATTDTYATGHRVYRATTSGGPYTEIAEVTPRTTTTYTDTPGTGTFYYVVRAYYQNWESANGNEASATTNIDITVTNTSNGTDSGTSSMTWSHTVSSGSSRILVVGISQRKNDKTITNITYGGVGGFTLAGSQTGSGTDGGVSIYYKVAPTVGTANIVVTFSGNVDAVGGALSLTGVHQTTPTGTFAGAGGTDAAPTVNVSSAAGELVVGVLSISGDYGSITIGGGQTNRWSGATGTADADEYGRGDTEAGASTVTMSWSVTNANKWAVGGLPLKPALVAAPSAPSGLTATSVSGTEIDLSWTDNSSNETGFKIERSPGGAGSWAEINTVGAGVTTYQNTGLSTSTTYDYRVRAYNGGGNSQYSNTASATTSACSAAPQTVSSVGDSLVYQAQPTTNYGTLTSIYVFSASAANGRSFVTFNLPTVPSGCSVTAATLKVYTSSGVTGRTLQAIRASASWTETGITWNNQPSTTGTAATAASVASGWVQWDVTAHVQAMYSGSNFGWELRDATEDAGTSPVQTMDSREGTNHPELVITYG